MIKILNTYTVSLVLIALWGVSVGAGAEEVTMEDRCKSEVIELHRFFQDWFNAELPNDSASFSRFEQVLAEDFEIIAPSGHLTGREGVLAAVRSGHGRDADGRRTIEVKNVRSRGVGDGLVLVTYEEHQTASDGHKGWQSSALFRAREGHPNGVEWLHVHETYLPGAEG